MGRMAAHKEAEVQGLLFVVAFAVIQPSKNTSATLRFILERASPFMGHSWANCSRLVYRGL